MQQKATFNNDQVMQTGDIKTEMARIAGKGHSAASSFEHSFGPMADRQRYTDPWAMDGKGNLGVDEVRPVLGKAAALGKMKISAKALGPESGGAGTAGFALVPVFVDPRIVDLSRKFTPLVELIPRVTNQGMTADFNIITAKGAAFTAGLDAPLTENDNTEDRRSENIKFLYSVGRVLGPMQAAMPSYILEGFQPSGAGNTNADPFSNTAAPSAKQFEVVTKARAMKELEENLILNGNVSTDATQFNGIIQQQSTTNQNDLSSAALTWDDIEDTVQLAYDDGGRPKLAVGSSSVVTDLRKIMIDTFRMSPRDIVGDAELPFGIPPKVTLATMVGDIPLIPSQFLSNTSGSKQLWFLDTDFIEVRVLQDMTFEELAKANDSNKFMLKQYECLISRAPQFNSYVDNIL